MKLTQYSVEESFIIYEMEDCFLYACSKYGTYDICDQMEFLVIMIGQS